ncbi:HFL006Wp [Eremothecium sinecaudum]|uniref:HFL006Wp n=1 Tax=Eremothecium sinecaudum TaxID=45286 RepID=A0A0X8HUR2_9SACH|nr:HFL006Wp [Eremothecium sinecaudum]AMD21850.1 HFL006Wp [Eremothecium sinecaudum]
MDHQDELLEMFFDEEFVPHAYLDILLSSKDLSIKDIQLLSNSLLSRLDYYTGRLTKQLEITIQKLQKPAEILIYSKLRDEHNIGTTKLEYYLDTLGNSMKLLESDIDKINTDLSELNKKYDDSEELAVKLNKLDLIKSRLTAILSTFDQLKMIMTISTGEDDTALRKVNSKDFKIALDTLKDTISTKLDENSAYESSNETNYDLIKKIDTFISLKPVLRGFSTFYPPYLEFANQIQAVKEKYLDQKPGRNNFS